MEALIEQGFKALSLDDKMLFDPYYEMMNQDWASTISFLSMIAWNQSIKIYYKVLKDYICCIADDTTSQRIVALPPIGFYTAEKVNDYLTALNDLFEYLKLPLVITDVSEWMCPYLLNTTHQNLTCQFDENLSDYIYASNDFEAALNKPDTRYAYHYFIRKKQPVLKSIDEVPYVQVIDFIRSTWCQDHTCTHCNYGCLADSMSGLLEGYTEIGGKGIVVYSEDQIIGYALVSMEKNQLIFHFKMGIHGCRGLNEYMHKECFRLFGEGKKWINYTEDMGILGLQSYKRRLAKYHLSHRYEIA